MDYVLLAVGLVLLGAGAEGLVRGGVGLARLLGVSPLMAGLTVVAWGTSAPELVVSVEAALTNHPGIAVGNVVGSNTFNILLILGLTALIAPLRVKPLSLARDGAFAVLAAALLAYFAFARGVIGSEQGAAFLLVLLIMVGVTYVQERRGAKAEPATGPAMSWPRALFFTFAGLGILLYGAHLLLEGAIAVARSWGVSETVIGLTLVAGGTSLPELAASAAAAVRRHPEIALGNVIGSNIYNILAILGTAALITPIPIPDQVLLVDLWVMLAATGALIVPILLFRGIPRAFGALYLAGYCGYVWWLFFAAT